MKTVEGPSHPIHRRLHAEDLVRLRRADEQRRYAAAQRRGRIDPNPHQIDAVVFALGRIPEGGCILADEVGLGKTIEAGLVISQLLAEGMRRMLLIVPKSLQGQWQTELYTLFGIETREGVPDPESFAGSGVFLTHRDLAGSSKGSSILKAVDPFDLVVVDEAHEVFAGVYKRFDKEGNYDDESPQAMTAGRVRDLVKMGGTPVLLLTATPIQNSLTELWGLVQDVEPTGTLLGKLPTFRELFCDGTDRSVLPAQAVDLRTRLGTVMQRTLRRQAQEFLEVPFVERRARLIEFSMSPEEKALYDEVTLWLMKPDLCAFRGNQRHLLLIGFHRRMASSLSALSASLGKVAERLREQLLHRDANASETKTGAEFAADLEEDAADFGDPPVEQPQPSPTTERMRAELATVSGFAQRCDALPHDSKARCLLDALRVIRDRAARGEGTDRAIIFTESLTTQDYLRRLLLENGVAAGDITLFRGNNDTPDARAALARWEEEVGSTLPPGNRPSREVALRLALVHEFRERSKVFISTEAGGKGLNLQFCDTLINYDLPWNPQKIEQRIGRIHRYGQRRSVTVISFLAKDNETQRLTFEILSQKLDLFGQVLDASDVVLHEPSTKTPESLVSSVAMDFEAQLRRIYDHARSLDDVAHELRVLRSSLESKREEFDSEQTRTAGLVESRLDDTIRQVFRKYVDELPTELAGLDADLERVVVQFLQSGGVPFDRQESPGRVTLRIGPASTLPDGYRDGGTLVIGDTKDLADGDALHVGHPLVRAAIEEARRASARRFSVDLAASEAPVPEAAARLGGRRGRLIVTKIAYRGIEPVDYLLKTAVVEGADDPLDPDTVDALLSLQAVDSEIESDATRIDAVEDLVADAILENQLATSERERERFERMLIQIDRYVEDQILVLQRRRAALEDRIEEAEKRRERAIASATRAKDDQIVASLQKDIQRIGDRIAILQRGDDADYQAWRDRLFARRFQKPEVERILDVSFRVRNGTGAAC